MKWITASLILFNFSSAIAESCFVDTYRSTFFDSTGVPNTENEARKVAELVCDKKEITLKDYLSLRTNIAGYTFHSHEDAVAIATMVHNGEFDMRDYLATLRGPASYGLNEADEAIEVARAVKSGQIKLQDYIRTRRSMVRSGFDHSEAMAIARRIRDL